MAGIPGRTGCCEPFLVRICNCNCEIMHVADAMLCQINSDHVMTYLGYLYRSSGPSEILLLFSGQVVQQAVKTQAESPEGLPALKAIGKGVGFTIEFQTTPDI